MRILGIDYGDKKIGLAFGDTEARMAVPLDVVLNRGEETIQMFADRARTEDIDLIVVGVPLATGGHHGPEQLKKTRAFIAALISAVSIPVKEEDESYTTSQSIHLQMEEGVNAEEDALAAMLIVQSYLSRLNEEV
ncbi:Holliday junction resolvase RuvX [Candidatus Uhrbacteria bacterium CG_4_9_14_3_um_filter_50_9]|uniref:Putative pre-16S rRNA nuclease n=1 Tax=Candidatus Uhrbacteria bacterium CG_4_9_14_3_um_filter_50_9 TaxID=1975035 RepID=A0A2M7XCR1_9BACT|nr:MAG: Holliday junction resolvase RuvX [Candidatus Uhrbacteria bacterium CG_4_9_14_3_um_filter_50_9]